MDVGLSDKVLNGLVSGSVSVPYFVSDEIGMANHLWMELTCNNTVFKLKFNGNQRKLVGGFFCILIRIKRMCF